MSRTRFANRPCAWLGAWLAERDSHERRWRLAKNERQECDKESDTLSHPATSPAHEPNLVLHHGV